MWEGEDQEHWVARPPFDGSQRIKMVTMLMMMLMMMMNNGNDDDDDDDDNQADDDDKNDESAASVEWYDTVFSFFLSKEKSKEVSKEMSVWKEMIQAAPFPKADMLVSPRRTFSLQTIDLICSSYDGANIAYLKLSRAIWRFMASGNDKIQAKILSN